MIYNPYARDGRAVMGHRVRDSFCQILRELSDELHAAGWPSRQASQAELLQAVLHFYLPRTIKEAAELLQAWGMVTSAPPRPARND